VTRTRNSAGLALLICVSSCGSSTTPDDAGAYDDSGGGADIAVLDGSGTDAAVHDGSDPGADAMSCEEKTGAASALLLAAETSGGTDLSCQTDDDCRTVWRITDCSDNCSTLTTRTIEEKIKAAIEEANATVCAGFRDAGCRLIIPPCAPPFPPVCAMGMCSAMPLSSRGSSR
jgi:hypothetical protein